MAFKLTVDKSGWNKLKKSLQGSQDELQVGFFENSRYGPENDNLPVAQVAQFNEEGTATNPIRPFIRAGFGPSLKEAKYQALFKDSMQRIVAGESSFKQEYTRLGPWLVEDMQQQIIKWNTPPNSPDTIAEKGFNDPLRDSDKMLDSVEFRIEKKGAN